MESDLQNVIEFGLTVGVHDLLLDHDELLTITILEHYVILTLYLKIICRLKRMKHHILSILVFEFRLLSTAKCNDTNSSLGESHKIIVGRCEETFDL